MRVLSGGEKARVALAKTMVSKANFLMLDEPTNHLDMHSCDLLIEALNKYAGSLILVSHDRYFISKTANKIWEIVDHQVKEFKGGYEEWVQWKERKAKQATKAKETENVKPQEKAAAPSKPVSPENNAKKTHAPINKEQKKEIQRLQKQFQQLEERISALKTELAQHEQSLASPEVYSDKEKFLQAESAYKKLEAELAKQNKEYEKVFERLVEFGEG